MMIFCFGDNLTIQHKELEHRLPKQFIFDSRIVFKPTHNLNNNSKMRYFLLFILLQLLYNHSTSQSPGNIQSNGNTVDKLNKYFEQKIIRQIDANKIKFTDLYDDVLLQIFSNLCIKDFLNLSKACPRLSSLINDTLRRTYGQFEFRVMSTNYDGTEKMHEYSENQFIEIYDLQTFEEILHHFGHSIKKVGFNNGNFNDNNSNALNRLIQEHCANTLTHLDLNFIKESTFESFNVPMNGVEELLFQVNLKSVNQGVLPLNELVPNLRRLRIELYSDTDYSFIECKFPKLEHLYMSATGPTRAFQRKEQIDGILRKNQQITSIHTFSFPGDYVKIIHELLPNVKRLYLHAFDIGDDKLHFEHVKHMTLYDDTAVSVNNLSFSNLESLDIVYSRRTFNSWMEFLRLHSHLREFNLTAYVDEEVPLLELTDELDDLIEMNLRCTKHINVDTIGQFIDSHKNLNRFHLSIRKFNDGDVQILKERYENEWHIRSDLLFERKTPIEM